MLQLPVVVGQMMDYYYFSTDEQIFFLILIYTLQLCLDVSTDSYPS